jgi:Hemerythrin HHE cation binding domain
MARPAQQRLASSGRTPASAAAVGSRPAEDVIELIMADHRRIRRLREALYDAVRFGGESDLEWVLAHIWQRLASLLEVHARAEEEICFLPMSGSAPGAAGRIRDAVCDHDDIREAVSEASLQRVGSAPWWRAVRAALAASAEHLEREEHGVLARCGLTESQRLGLGRQWAGFVAALRQDVNPGPSRSSRPD